MIAKYPYMDYICIINQSRNKDAKMIEKSK